MNVFGALLAGLLFTFSGTAYAQNAHGILKVVKGDVQIKAAKNGQTVKARLGEKVFPKDIVITAKDSRAKIVMVDNNEINVSPESQIEIQHYEYDPKAGKKEVLLNVIYGKVRAKVEQKYDGRTSKFQVKTPAAVAGVRGTDFMTSFNRTTRASNVVTFHGKVEFGLPGPGGSIANAVFVGPGTEASTVGGSMPTAPAPVPKEQLAQLDTESAAEPPKADGAKPEAGGSDGAADDKKEEKKDDGAKKDDSAKKDDGAKKEEGKKEEAKKDETKSEKKETTKKEEGGAKKEESSTAKKEDGSAKKDDSSTAKKDGASSTTKSEGDKKSDGSSSSSSGGKSASAGGAAGSASGDAKSDSSSGSRSPASTSSGGSQGPAPVGPAPGGPLAGSTSGPTIGVGTGDLVGGGGPIVVPSTGTGGNLTPVFTPPPTNITNPTTNLPSVGDFINQKSNLKITIQNQ